MIRIALFAAATFAVAVVRGYPAAAIEDAVDAAILAGSGQMRAGFDGVARVGPLPG